MTEQEKIRKLAEWMGWHEDRGLWVDTVNKAHGWSSEEYCSNHEKPWNPCKHIQDAWMLIEHAKKCWCFVVIHYAYEDQPDDGWYCHIGIDRFNGYHPDSATVAICEAVLRMMEGGKKRATPCDKNCNEYQYAECPGTSGLCIMESHDANDNPASE